MERLPQICGFDSQTATYPTSTTPQNPSNWIDYEHAESLLFDALKPELRLTTSDHARLFGEDVAGMTDEVAESVYSKAEAILHQHGHRRVFGDAHLFKKLQQWAKFWCDKYAAHHRPRRHSLYSPESAALGRQRGNKTIQIKTDRRAYMAQDWRRKGVSIKRIAKRLKAGISTVYKLLKREVAPWFGKAGKIFSFGKYSCTVPQLIASKVVQEKAPNEKLDSVRAQMRPDGRCSEPDRAELDALGALCNVLRQHLSRVLLA